MTTTLDSLAHWQAQLPPAPEPLGAYVPAVRHGQFIYTAGTLPMQNGELLFRGPVGGDGLSIEQGQQAARQCILNALSVISVMAGGLEQIEKVIKVTGFVQSSQGFHQQPQVINGASHLLAEILGPEVGQHARSAVGVSHLPINAPVEIELIVALKAST